MDFVDRENEQTEAFRAVEEWHGQSRPLCLALSGVGGAGRTELAFRIARALRDRCPDGVLYVDLDDLRHDGAVEIADALGDVLRSLGVRPEWMEHSLKARSKQYWAQTDGKRLVVVLDNVRYGAEAVPLLPASGDSVVIVVSHGPLHDLVDGAVVDLALDPLEDVHAMELLQKISRDDPRLTAEPEAATELIRLCSGLPAALHVAARWMRKHRRRSLTRLLAELTAELQEKGMPVVEGVWDAAYRGLGPKAALLYRLLADHPGPSFTPEAAAALLGEGKDTADDALDELETAGLLHPVEDRLRLHELLRAHAKRCSRRDGGEQERVDGHLRLVRWYLRQAQRADALAAGARLTLAPVVPPLQGAPDVLFAAKEQALLWLEAERHALYGCVRIAYARGLDSETWALCEPLWTHYLDHPHYADVMEAFRTGVRAAQRAEHVPALVRMRCQLARPLWEQGLFEQAEDELRQALAACGALGESDQDRKLRASAVEFRGMLSSARGNWSAAAVDFETSRQMHGAIGNAYGVMLQTYRLGQAVAALGEPERAAALLEQAHATAGELGRERIRARIGFALGSVLRTLRQEGRARELYVAALTSARERGADHDEAQVLDGLASLAEESGNMAEARAHQDAARNIRQRNGRD
ncbi:NB-ARC domain-containing protein [Streptomyces hygroscopicus]|uniref:NB-ARC domain-containing protein n=1 Tax=Streptomyces hygroscopicus TaxID=1912 RepID=UPI00207BA53E|nr:NB-ARC domain-containing protein [Streptomyces hygroscopicus]